VKRRTILITLLHLCFLSGLETIGCDPIARAARIITIIVPTAVGSATDYGSRVFAREMERQLGQNFVVINVVGVDAYKKVATARPDGTTLVVCTKRFNQYEGARKISGEQFEPVAGFAAGRGLLAPKNTTRAVIDRLEQATQRVTRTSSFKEILAKRKLVASFVPSNELLQKVRTW